MVIVSEKIDGSFFLGFVEIATTVEEEGYEEDCSEENDSAYDTAYDGSDIGM